MSSRRTLWGNLKLSGKGKGALRFSSILVPPKTRRGHFLGHDAWLPFSERVFFDSQSSLFFADSLPSKYKSLLSFSPRAATSRVTKWNQVIPPTNWIQVGREQPVLVRLKEMRSSLQLAPITGTASQGQIYFLIYFFQFKGYKTNKR